MAEVLYVEEDYFVDGYVETGLSISRDDTGTGTIVVPTFYMAKIQTSPTVIYELDTNIFRLDLKALEAAAEGMPFLRTHSHNQPVTVGGVTLARVINIINNYTVTFEDGQYAVNLKGSNNNIGDVVNVNSVSVRSSNSAGLTTLASVEFMEFGGVVLIDTAKGTSGTAHPRGTRRTPSTDIDDALIIASANNINTIEIAEDYLIPSGTDISGIKFIGTHVTKAELTIEAGCNTDFCEFSNLTVTGELDGFVMAREMTISDVIGLECIAFQTMLAGDVLLNGTKTSHFLDCYSGGENQTSVPEIDFGGAGRTCTFKGYKGGVKLVNKTGTEPCFIVLNGGGVIIDGTVTNGEIRVTGTGTVIDNGTATVITDNLVKPATIDAGLSRNQFMGLK